MGRPNNWPPIIAVTYSVIWSPVALLSLLMIVSSSRFGEFEPVHARHFDVGDDHVELAALLEQSERFVRRADRGHVVAGGFEHWNEHVAEERGIIDEQKRARQRLGTHFLAAEPILERERQEVADVDDFGRLALDDRAAEHAGGLAADLDVELV